MHRLFFKHLHGIVALLVTSSLSAATPRLLRDIHPSASGVAGGSSPALVVGSNYFFKANNGTDGEELWKTDGTSAGTTMVLDINPGAASSSPAGFVSLGGVLYFSANDGTHGRELWRSDGTTAGTTLVLDVVPGTNNGVSGPLFDVGGGEFYFWATSITAWHSDGTSVGTVAVPRSPWSPSYHGFARAGAYVYFAGFTSLYGEELFRTNGTTTSLASDFISGSGSSTPTNVSSVAGDLYFVAESFPGGRQVWHQKSSGGSSEGLGASTGIFDTLLPSPFFSIGGNVFFSGVNSSTSLYKSDGTKFGTSILESSANETSVFALTLSGSTLYLRATTPTNGAELWKTNGTSAGTMLVKDINPGSASSSPVALTEASGKVYLSATDAAHGSELWRTDGSAAGTVLLADVEPGATGSSPVNARQVGNKLVFMATTTANGTEPWSITLAGPDVLGLNGSNVTSTGATFNSTVNANGAATTVKLEYGLTTSYGSNATVAFSPNNGSADKGVSLTLSTLLPTTTYHARLTATNSQGSASSSDIVFTTRSATDATLSTLTTSVGTLSPAFDSATTSYLLIVPQDNASLSLTPTLSNGSATLTVNGVTQASGAASAAISTPMGLTTVAISVVAADQSTTRTYEIKIVRPPASPPTARFNTLIGDVLEGGTVRVRVVLSSATDTLVTVPLTLLGDATDGIDYAGVPTSVVFQPGEDATFFDVVITQDASIEVAEQVGLQINPANIYSFYILDDDSVPTVQFEQASAQLSEGVGSVSFRVKLSHPVASAVSVPITTNSGGSSTDYSGVPSSVTFAAGETSKVISLTLTDDDATEGDETFSLLLGTPVGATIGGNASITVSILDNEPAIEPLSQWTLRHPGPSASSLRAVASTPVRQIIVGEGGGILTSEDQGVTWTTRYSGTHQSLACVAWTGQCALAAGRDGLMLWSEDGRAWSPALVESFGGSGMLHGLAASPTRMVAVGGRSRFVDGLDEPAIFSSTDGWRWLPADVPLNMLGELRSVVWTGTQFVAVGHSAVLTSVDGLSWTDRSDGIGQTAFNSVTWTGSSLVALDESKNAFVSADGITWIKRTIGTLGNVSVSAWNGTQLVGAGAVLAASTDGRTWTQSASPSKLPFVSLTWTGSVFLAVNEAGGIYTSTTGSTWLRRSTGIESNSNLRGVVWTGTQWVTVGGDDQIAAVVFTSPDAITWTPRTVTAKTSLRGVAWSGSTLCAVGTGGVILTSTNGISWAARTSGTTLNLQAVIWAGNQFVAVGGSEDEETTGEFGTAVLTSPNGTTWTRRTVPSNQPLEDVAWNGRVFVAVGRAVVTPAISPPGELLVSMDAITWVHWDSTSGTMHDVEWNGINFVTVGDNGQVRYSPDGMIWSPATGLPDFPNTRCLGRAYGNLVALGENGVVLTTGDGSAWAQGQPAVNTDIIYGAAWNGSTLVAVGSHLSIQTTGSVTPSTPTARFDLATSSVSENAGTAGIVVDLEPAPTTPTTVFFEVAGTATRTGSAADVTVPASPLIFKPGESRKIIPITLKNDKLHESDETVILSLMFITNGTPINTPTTHTVTITDDDTAPTIDPMGQPQHHLRPVGDSVLLEVQASGDSLSYQWKKNNAAISGATSSIYFIPKVAFTHAGTYTCVITNGAGSVTTTPVEVGVFDKIVKHIAIGLGKDAVLTQIASGNNLSFAWYKDGSATELAPSPPHIVYDATKKTLTVKGLTTGDVGQYQCLILQTNSSQLWNGNTYDIDFVAAKPTLDAITLPGGQIGQLYSRTIPPGSGSPPIASWSASGLPAGLSMNALTGEISGYPSASVTNKSVTITATNGMGSASRTATLTILGMPSGLIGTTTGLMEINEVVNNNLGARMQFAITAAGTFTGSYSVGSASPQSFIGNVIVDTSTNAHGSTTFFAGTKRITVDFVYPGSPGHTIKGDVTVQLPGDPAQHIAHFTARRKTTNASAVAGRYNCSLTNGTFLAAQAPVGFGYVAAVVASNGTITWNGKLADGTPLIASSAAEDMGTTTFVTTSLYVTLYGGRGSLAADLTVYDAITGVAKWHKFPDLSPTARTYADGWTELSVGVQGQPYTAPASTAVVMGMTYVTGNANTQIKLFDPYETVATFDSTFAIKPGGGTVMPAVNPLRIALTITPSTGAFKGTMNRTEVVNGVTIKRDPVALEGLLVAEDLSATPAKYRGLGFYLLPALPDSNVSPLPPAASTRIYSAQIELIPLP